jgi:ketosteroid isomerase-like protein
MSAGGPTTEDDRREIHETVLRYCRAVDRLDLAGVRALYAEDGVDHHTGFDGTADDFVAWLARMLPLLDGTMHLISNHLCEIDGDQAVAESYGTATHWGTPADEPAVNFSTGFRYVDHFVRTPEGWRIRERCAVREWARVDAGRLSGTGGDGPRAGRGDSATDDPLVGLRLRVLGL